MSFSSMKIKFVIEPLVCVEGASGFWNEKASG